MHRIVALVLGVAVALPLAASAQENWPQFRGPGALGSAEGPNWPETWSTTTNVLWKTAIPGRGWSSPVVWGDKVFLTAVLREGPYEEVKKGLYLGGERKPTADVHRWMVYALDWASGKVVWEKQVHRGVPEFPIHRKNSYASETPVTDGERLYAAFGNLGVYCLTLDGRVLWSKKVGPYKMRLGWGPAASPVLHGDRLYLVHDNEEQSFLLALDKKTGEQVWRVNRDEKSNWATPYIWENALRTEIVTSGTDKVRSYDLDGKLLWELRGMSAITIPTPFARFGLLYLGSGYVLDPRKPLYAIRPGAHGDISLKEGERSNAFIAWCNPKAAPYNPSPVIGGDTLYVLYDRGLFAAYEARTGKTIYAPTRIGPGATAFTASPWTANGKIFCLSEDGDTFVIQAGPVYQLLGKNSLGEMCLATPALARGSVLIRTETKLYRIQNGAKAEK